MTQSSGRVFWKRLTNEDTIQQFFRMSLALIHPGQQVSCGVSVWTLTPPRYWYTVSSKIIRDPEELREFTERLRGYLPEPQEPAPGFCFIDIAEFPEEPAHLLPLRQKKRPA